MRFVKESRLRQIVGITTRSKRFIYSRDENKEIKSVEGERTQNAIKI